MFDYKGEPYWTISVWTYGRIEVQFEMLKTKPPFDSEERRLEFLRRLNQIPNLPPFPEESIARRPSFPISVLSEEGARTEFLAALDWLIDEIARTM